MLVAKIIAYSDTKSYIVYESCTLATEVLQILHSERQACIIKVWLVTLTDEKMLAGNRRVQGVVTYMLPVEVFCDWIKIFDATSKGNIFSA